MKKSIAVLARMMAMVVCIATVSSCNDDDEDDRSSLASIYTVTFADQAVVKTQPTLDDSTTPPSFVFYVRHDATDSDLSALVPTIEVTPGATISPESGKAQDFSDGKTVKYTVTSEDGSRTQDYSLVCKYAASDEAYVVSVTIEEEDIIAVQPVIDEDGKSAIFYTNPGTTDEEKKSLTPVIEFVGADISPKSGEPQDFSEGEVEYTITADDGTKTKFTLQCENALYEGALIEEISFDSDLLSKELIIDGNNITIYVTGVATDAEIAALAPSTLVISDGASINYHEGEAPGFEDGIPVEYIVTAENGEENIYVITCLRNVVYYSLDNWYIANEGATYEYYMEKQWCNANQGVLTAIGMGAGIPFPLQPTDDTPSGTGYAAELKSHKTAFSPGLLPGFVAGNMYLGGFHLSNALRPLTATKFGIPITEKPLKVTGMFKYIPGSPDDYYKNYTHSPGNYDEFAMTALLYEVSDEGDYDEENEVYLNNNFGDTITGADMANITSDARVVAIKQVFGSETYSEFTPFELELDYNGNEWDPEKKYKFTVIFSSSRNGASFIGSIGSTLILDDIYILLQ